MNENLYNYKSVPILSEGVCGMRISLVIYFFHNTQTFIQYNFHWLILSIIFSLPHLYIIQVFRQAQEMLNVLFY